MSTAIGVNLEPHRLCLMFPAMQEEVYVKLLESVKKHGATKPIVLLDGKILDGRNRYRAYTEAGVDFECVDWNGEYETPLEFVLMENEVRRDMTPSQRAALAVEVKRELGAEYIKQRDAALKRGDYRPEVPKNPRSATNCGTGDSRADAAERMGVNHQYVTDAEHIQETSPETFEEVKRGEKSIPQAKRELGLSKPRITKTVDAHDHKEKPFVIVDGETYVNGAFDPAVKEAEIESRIKAMGFIRTNPKPKLVIPEAVEDIREEYEEQAAKRDEITDEEWLAALPLEGKLAGHVLDKFRRDALYFRDFEPIRRSLKDFHGKAKGRRFKGSTSEGFVPFRVGQLLALSHPKAWMECRPMDQGGCGGTGTVGMIGQCPMCHGRGYLAR